MATYRTISGFKSALSGGGARPNLFEVTIPAFPAGIGWDDEEFNFMCKAAALPASNMAPIEVPFRGRIFKVAGDRTFDTWTVTVINDEDFILRSSFEKWMNLMSKLDNNTGATNPFFYMVNANVSQLGRGASQGRFSANNDPSVDVVNGGAAPPLRTYQFIDIFPTNVSAIDLSYESSDTIEEYTVEFQVQYWTAGAVADQTGDLIE
jgi:hypothetical protein